MGFDKHASHEIKLMYLRKKAEKTCFMASNEDDEAVKSKNDVNSL